MGHDTRVLLLGGTAQGRVLASALVQAGFAVTTSLAGRTRTPAPVPGNVRVGGFGGVAGLVTWLRDNKAQLIVNATHPFAAQMSANALAASQRLGLPLLRLSRPSWGERPDSSRWNWVPDHETAANVAASLKGTVFLAVGRQSLPHYFGIPNRVVARVADATGLAVPDDWVLVESRGPFSLASETEFFDTYGIAVLVAKDSGGPHAEAKLDVCTARGLDVVVVARPISAAVTETVYTIDDAVAWAKSHSQTAALVSDNIDRI